MSSSYSKGTRIALHYIVDGIKNYAELQGILTDIIDECGEDVSLSTHCINTNQSSWKSVVQKDHFFKDVKVIDKVQKFIDLIKIDRVLMGIDIAMYITSKIQCTHLKLEKLVYLCYADYLCKFDKKLYQDKIFAFKYGPVVESVYNKYKKYGYKEIEQDEKEILKTTASLELPSKSRILFAEDGIEKIASIDSTLKKYGSFSASKLVELTHRDFTPWSLAEKGTVSYKVIEDNIIKKYHSNEEI